MKCVKKVGELTCGGFIKPNITFFGEALPKAFFKAWEKIEDIDEEEEKSDDVKAVKDAMTGMVDGMRNELNEITKDLGGK